MLSGPGRRAESGLEPGHATHGVVVWYSDAVRRRLSLLIVFAVVAFPAGLLVGWLIWG
jgi:hypothetical protein